MLARDLKLVISFGEILISLVEWGNNGGKFER